MLNELFDAALRKHSLQMYFNNLLVLDESRAFLAGMARSHMPMSVIYFHSGDRLSRGDILVTPTQCAGKCFEYTQNLAVCYGMQAAVGCPATLQVYVCSDYDSCHPG